jgi:hypothetical protein
MSVSSYTETQAEKDARLSKVVGHYARAIEGLNARGDYPVDSGLANVLQRASDYIGSLEAENAALRDDAERYWWLRERCDVTQLEYNSWYWCFDIAANETDSLPGQLDAAIDAARK